MDRWQRLRQHCDAVGCNPTAYAVGLNGRKEPGLRRDAIPGGVLVRARHARRARPLQQALDSDACGACSARAVA
eukprot:1106229-Rhodomonas_salina.3